MYQTSLFFVIKHTIAEEKRRIVEIFFKSWVDGNCNNEVNIDRVKFTADLDWYMLIRADFENSEDAVAIKLKGVPVKYQNYIEIVDLST